MLEKFAPVLALPENADLLSRLDRMAEGRKLPHAVIIECSAPDSALSCAMAAARAFLCDCEVFLSGQCRSCRQMGGDFHPDVQVVTGSLTGGAFTVEDIRKVRADAFLVPVEARGKVYILPGCDNMRQEAQNALLKVFEEPPEGVMFILICSSAVSLLETIRSRAQTLRLQGMEAVGEDIPEWIRELAGQFAASLCEQGDGKALVLLSRFVRERKEAQTARLELRQMIFVLREIIREALLISTGAAEAEGRSRPARRMASSIPRNKLFGMLETLDGIEGAIAVNVSAGLLTTAMVVRLKR